VPAEYERIATELRALATEVGVGGEMPHRVELAARFGVSRSTINQAMSLLREEGRVVSRGRGGTVVASDPIDWRARALAAEARLAAVRDALR